MSKIKYFEIEKYNQFEKFKLDLTYPKGHEKEGQAMEKVCFIGQSGTGKTSLLELLLYLYGNSMSVGLSPKHPNWVFNKFVLEETNQLLGTLYLATGKNKTKLNLNIPSNFEANPILSAHFTRDVTIDNGLLEQSWGIFKTEISDYQRNRTSRELEVAREFTSGNMILAEDKKKKFLEWEKNNPSPLQHLADAFLDPILSNFKLKVKTVVDSEEEANFIGLVDLNGKTIPRQFWSTGIEQIINTLLPIYTQETPSIIFIDEPETSLYPDIQEIMVESCVKIAKPGSQVFFATHSPIIASRFEPWEIVHLVFDKDYNVVQRPYYDVNKERHVDNYTIDPRLLRWDDLLQKVFQMDEEGNSDFRTPKLMELAALESKIKKLKAQGNANGELTNLWEEYKKLAELLDWETD